MGVTIIAIQVLVAHMLTLELCEWASPNIVAVGKVTFCDLKGGIYQR